MISINIACSILLGMLRLQMFQGEIYETLPNKSLTDLWELANLRLYYSGIRVLERPRLYRRFGYNINLSKPENTYEANVRLESELLQGYRKETRPVLNDKDNVTITIGVSLYLIKNMDDKDQILTTSLWIRQKWNDPRLTWQPSKFSFLKSINVRSDKVWLPDVKVYNEIDRRKDSGLDQFRTRVIIDHTGNVLWMAPSILRSSCQVDVELFPYDTQTCAFKIGSWTYDGFAVDVIPENYTMDTAKSPSNPEWLLVSTLVQRNVQTYPCCPESYPDITYTIKIKRRVQSYWMNFIYPGIFLTLMTMLAFITPAADTGERIGLVVTSLVSMFFFLKMIAERTPSSDTIPLLSIYFVMLSFEIGLIYYSVCICVTAYYKNPAFGNMPWYIRSVILEKLGRLWRLTKDGKAITTKLDTREELYLEENGSIMNSNKVHCSTCDTSDSRQQNVEGEDSCGNSTEKQTLPKIIVVSCKEGKTYDMKSLPTTSNVSKTAIYGNDFLWQANNRVTPRNQQHAPSQQSTSTRQEIQKIPCSCPTLLQKMIVANVRMLSSLREILYIACQFDKDSSEKERWLLAASILDRTFLILFVSMFIVLSVILLIPWGSLRQQ